MKKSTKKLDRNEAAESGERCENIITAKNGKFTYKVYAYRLLTKDELKQVVWNALQSGEIMEPKPGGVARLITAIGKP